MTLQAVEINAGSDVINADRTGAKTVVDEVAINTVPTIQRDIADFAKLTPQASVNGKASTSPTPTTVSMPSSLMER